MAANRSLRAWYESPLAGTSDIVIQGGTYKAALGVSPPLAGREQGEGDCAMIGPFNVISLKARWYHVWHLYSNFQTSPYLRKGVLSALFHKYGHVFYLPEVESGP